MEKCRRRRAVEEQGSIDISGDRSESSGVTREAVMLLGNSEWGGGGSGDCIVWRWRRGGMKGVRKGWWQAWRWQGSGGEGGRELSGRAGRLREIWRQQPLGLVWDVIRSKRFFFQSRFSAEQEGPMFNSRSVCVCLQYYHECVWIWLEEISALQKLRAIKFRVHSWISFFFFLSFLSYYIPRYKSLMAVLRYSSQRGF